MLKSPVDLYKNAIYFILWTVHNEHWIICSYPQKILVLLWLFYQLSTMVRCNQIKQKTLSKQTKLQFHDFFNFRDLYSIQLGSCWTNHQFVEKTRWTFPNVEKTYNRMKIYTKDNNHSSENSRIRENTH